MKYEEDALKGHDRFFLIFRKSSRIVFFGSLEMGNIIFAQKSLRAQLSSPLFENSDLYLQHQMSLDSLFKLLLLDADVPLCYSGGTVL